MLSPKLAPLLLTDAERGALELLVRKRTASQSLVQRARITELETDIRKWINEWNKDPRPYTWAAKTADEILDTLAAYCQRISEAS